jgi:hypothetical protein
MQKDKQLTFEQIVKIIGDERDTYRRRVKESQAEIARYDLEQGWERDQLTYRMGFENACTHFLICLGVER